MPMPRLVEVLRARDPRTPLRTQDQGRHPDQGRPGQGASEQGQRSGGGPPAFDQVHDRDRNTVERAVNRLRAHLAAGTRYDKRDYMYRGTVTVAAIWLWLRDHVTGFSLLAPAKPGLSAALAA
jgi:hypothetical protein